MNDAELRQMAKDRVEFRDHLYIFVLINIILAGINMFFSPMFYWFPLVTFFWGIGLFFHYREAYVGNRAVEIEREYKKLKATEKKK